MGGVRRRTWLRAAMKIHLRLFGELKRYLPAGATGRQATVDLPDGLDALGLILHLGIPYDAEEGAIVVAINDTQVDHGAPVQDGDVVSMFAPLAGGSGEAQGSGLRAQGRGRAVRNPEP